MENTLNSLQPELKVSIGAGRAKIPGFQTVDIDPESSPDHVMDIQDLKFAPGTVAVIYASHVFEHMRPPAEKGGVDRWTYLVELLSSWKKCLSENGQLYICVPDMNKLSKMLVDYPENSNMQQTSLDAIFGGARNEFDFHYSGFTKPILTELLRRAGFKNVTEFQPFADDESTHRINGINISLNLLASNSSEAPAQISRPASNATETNELTMYRDAADERLKEILTLQKICDEREKLIFELDAKLKEKSSLKKNIKKTLKDLLK